MLTVLRLGHRRIRDARLSTHMGLTARALGADAIIYSGEKDQGILASIKKIVSQWGGDFKVEYAPNWKKTIQGFQGTKIHLTMYGSSLQHKISEIRNLDSDLLLILGSEKVPPEVYQLSDYNISVTSQPHSEVAALAVFLDQYFQGKELAKTYPNSKIQVIPSGQGKKVNRKTQ